MKIQTEGFWDGFKQGVRQSAFGNIITNHDAWKQSRADKRKAKELNDFTQQKLNRYNYTDEEKTAILNAVTTAPRLEPILTRQKINNVETNVSLLVSAFNQNVLDIREVAELATAPKLSYEQLSYIVYGVKNGMDLDDFRMGKDFMSTEQMEDTIIDHEEYPEEYSDLSIPKTANDKGVAQVNLARNKDYDPTSVIDYLKVRKEEEVPDDILANIFLMQVANKPASVIKDAIKNNLLDIKDTVITYLTNEYGSDAKTIKACLQSKLPDSTLISAKNSVGLTTAQNRIKNYVKQHPTQPQTPPEKNFAKGGGNETNNAQSPKVELV